MVVVRFSFRISVRSFCWGFRLAGQINIFFVYRGLSQGIEKFCSWAMPIMAVCALIVLIRVLDLGHARSEHLPEQSVVNGLGQMWNPDLSALANPQTWLAAAGQIFFSLSVGFGVIINYASYMKKKDDVVLSGITASATNELFEVGFGGMITIPAAFVFLGATGTIAAVETGSFGLGFNTLPVVFAHMGTFGNFIGATFFFMLFLAAITSSLSMYQPTLAFLQEALGVSRKSAVTMMVAICLVGSAFTIYFSQGGDFRSTIDDWVGTFLIFVLAMVQIMDSRGDCAWVFERGWKELHAGASIRVPPVFKIVMKYIAPAYLIIVFVGFTAQNFKDSLAASWANTGARVGMFMIAAILVFLIIVTWFGARRLRAAGFDIDDNSPAD